MIVFHTADRRVADVRRDLYGKVHLEHTDFGELQYQPRMNLAETDWSSGPRFGTRRCSTNSGSVGSAQGRNMNVRRVRHSGIQWYVGTRRRSTCGASMINKNGKPRYTSACQTHTAWTMFPFNWASSEAGAVRASAFSSIMNRYHVTYLLQFHVRAMHPA